jgi:thioredoxin reductase (NADPH)
VQAVGRRPTGARFNRLPLGRLAEFEAVGVYYAATQMEAQACRADPVAILYRRTEQELKERFQFGRMAGVARPARRWTSPTT